MTIQLKRCVHFIVKGTTHVNPGNMIAGRNFVYGFVTFLKKSSDNSKNPKSLFKISLSCSIVNFRQSLNMGKINNGKRPEFNH